MRVLIQLALTVLDLSHSFHGEMFGLEGRVATR